MSAYGTQVDRYRPLSDRGYGKRGLTPEREQSYECHHLYCAQCLRSNELEHKEFEALQKSHRKNSLRRARSHEYDARNLRIGHLELFGGRTCL